MANMMLRLPCTMSLRSFSVSASTSNGATAPSPASGGGGPVIVELPLEKIRRPLMRTRSNDQNKVKELMDSISKIGLQVPIDVLEVDGAYYGKDTSLADTFRRRRANLPKFQQFQTSWYEAHQRLGLPTIRCKVRKGTKETLRHHLR